MGKPGSAAPGCLRRAKDFTSVLLKVSPVAADCSGNTINTLIYVTEQHWIPVAVLSHPTHLSEVFCPFISELFTEFIFQICRLNNVIYFTPYTTIKRLDKIVTCFKVNKSCKYIFFLNFQSSFPMFVYSVLICSCFV